jgi:dephospho-CoA kinase
VARPLSEEASRDLLTRQAALTALTQHPSWPELEAELNRKEERVRKGVLAKALAGGPTAGSLTLEEMAFWRGFLQGMRYVIAVPVGAEDRLERLLTRPRKTEEDE